jgi:hypothetical protein
LPEWVRAEEKPDTFKRTEKSQCIDHGKANKRQLSRKPKKNREKHGSRNPFLQAEHQLTATSILQVTLPAVHVYNAIPLPEVLDTLNKVTPK